jgi:transposase
VRRAKVVGITWPIPSEIGDAALEGLLFTPAGLHEGSTKRLPDWSKVHEELKRRSVTLMILWEEHRTEHVDGHGYSRYVAVKFMLRLPGRARDTADFPGPMHNIERAALDL